MLKNIRDKNLQNGQNNSEITSESNNFRELMRKSSSSTSTKGKGKLLGLNVTSCSRDSSSVLELIDDEQIKSFITELVEALEEKEKDLMLAAEVGQHLLTQNQEMCEELVLLKQGLTIDVDADCDCDQQQDGQVSMMMMTDNRSMRRMGNSRSNNSTPRKMSGGFDSGKGGADLAVDTAEYIRSLEDENQKLKQELEAVKSCGTPNSKIVHRQVDLLEKELELTRSELEQTIDECESLRIKIRKLQQMKDRNNSGELLKPTTTSLHLEDSDLIIHHQYLHSQTNNNHSIEYVHVGIQNDMMTESVEELLRENESIRALLEQRGFEINSLSSQLSDILVTSAQQSPIDSQQPSPLNLDEELQKAQKGPGVIQVLGDLLIAVAMLPVMIGRDVATQLYPLTATLPSALSLRSQQDPASESMGFVASK